MCVLLCFVYVIFLCNRENIAFWMLVEMPFEDCMQQRFIQYLSLFDRDLSMLSCMLLYAQVS